MLLRHGEMIRTVTQQDESNQTQKSWVTHGSLLLCHQITDDTILLR